MKPRNKRTKKYWQTLFQRMILISVILLLPIIFTTLGTTNHQLIPRTESVANQSMIASKTPETNIDLPVQLKIPVIGVDTVIRYSGLTADGAMAIDSNPNEVAWYQLGSRPGEIGSAVIAGHYGWTFGVAAVFNGLKTLGVGDKISVTTNNGTTIDFIVHDIKRYDPNADASDIFKSYDGKSHLNLITCDGSWDNERQTYSDRLVIFADKDIDK